MRRKVSDMTPEQLKEHRAKDRERKAKQRVAKAEPAIPAPSGKAIPATAPAPEPAPVLMDNVITIAGAAKWNPTPNQAARSSIAVTEKIADPANVAELHALAGKLYTIDEIAATLGVTTRAVQLYVKSGKLRGVKIGGSWRVSAANFKKFIEGDCCGEI